MDKLKNIYEWIDVDLRLRLKKNSYIQKELKTKPIINVAFYSTLVQILELQIMQEVYDGKFTCQSKKDALYIKFCEQMSIALSKLKNKKNIYNFKNTIWHSIGGLFIEKINHDFCKRKIPGNKDKISKTQFRWLQEAGFVDTYNEMVRLRNSR